MSVTGRRYRLNHDWNERPAHPALAWTVAAGTTFVYVDTVPYLDWFQALVMFEGPVTVSDGRVLPAGTRMRAGYGITDARFSTEQDG